MKLVSVIITTHQGSKYIQKAINSVRNQDYEPIEIIVVDDNGRNTKEQKNTSEKVNCYLKNEKFKYIVHEVNKNGAVARNTGVANSSGEYIAFLDDDDIYLPNKISSCVRALEILDESWGMVYCSVLINYGKKKIVKKAKKSGKLLFELLTNRINIGSSSMLMKRKVFEEIKGFDESFLRHQDYEFTARVAKDYKIKAVSEIGFVYNRGVARNSPKTTELAKGYREHYLSKMLPLINLFDPRKKQVIIAINAFEVTSSNLKRGNISKFKNEFSDFISPWLESIRKDVFILVFSEKIIRLIKRRVKLISA